MPSQLTRHVFRRILANQPILHRECLRRRASTAIIRRSNENGNTLAGRNGPSRPPQRTFFNINMFAGRKKRHGQEADMDPGIEEMMQLAKLERMRARLPPVEDVARALRQLFEHKRKKGSVLEDTQAQLALQSLQYVSRRGGGGEGGGGAIERETLKTATVILSRPPQTDVAAHPELAKAVYDEIASLEGPGGLTKAALEMYVRNLAGAGQAKRAREVLVEFESQAGDASGLSLKLECAWEDVLHGIAQQDDETELLATFAMLKNRKLHERRRVRQTMLAFRLRGNNVDAVKEAWTDLRPSLPPRNMGAQLRQLLQWCLSHQQYEYGHQIVREAITTSANPPKATWDAVFLWAAGTGKGADEINRMFGVMEASNNNNNNSSSSSNSIMPEDEEPRIPDITTINLLLEFAISKNDPYLAERFIALGASRSISPNARTYMLQMQYRLKVNDLDGALTAYANSQSMDLSSNEDIPTVNALIVALCNSSRHDFDSIMNIAADLSDRNARFEATTVSALALLHLSRDEIHDTIDLLNTHAFHFSSSERSSITSSILTFALDPQTPTSRTWDAYTILRQIFDEIPRAPRTDLMLSFFERQRPDMAVHVFNHMRQHSRIDTLPTVETYISAFAGSARVKDLESLEVIHNQLKLDFNINPTTKLYNALIASYTSCGQPRRALRFWDDIATSREGPDYESIHITFQACEKAPFGDLQARELWGKLKRKGVDTTRDQNLWKSYVGGLAGNGDLEYVMNVLETGEREGEVLVDEGVLGRLFNAVPGKVKQGFVQEWAQGRWPGVWKRLEEGGWEGRGDGGRVFKLKEE